MSSGRETGSEATRGEPRVLRRLRQSARRFAEITATGAFLTSSASVRARNLRSIGVTPKSAVGLEFRSISMLERRRNRWLWDTHRLSLSDIGRHAGHGPRVAPDGSGGEEKNRARGVAYRHPACAKVLPTDLIQS